MAEGGAAAARLAKGANVRNLCVLAHVDHGKTTLTDSLVASNGLIHPKMAGKLRYMDSRDDEQQRGITMKASCVSLLYRHPELAEDYVLHLVDSPGHVDFDAEAAAAARVSDGAYVVVDAAEGVRVQTRAALRRTFDERLAPVLVINKLDRLFSELAMEPLEVFQRCQKLVADANAVVSAFHSERHLAEADNDAQHDELSAAPAPDTGDNSASYWGSPAPFSAARGNVVFASAIDGWAFRTLDFARIYAAKWGCSTTSLTKVLFGDFAFNAKTKKVSKAGKSGPPMFAQFVVEPLAKIYAIRDASLEQGRASSDGEPPHTARLRAIAASLGLDADPAVAKDLGNRDANIALRALLQAWLPLSDTLMAAAVQCFPPPEEALAYRWPALCPGAPALTGDASSARAPVLFFVAKMAVVPPSLLGRDGSEDELIAFGRVFHGSLVPGQRLFVLGNHGGLRSGVVEAIYLSMGRAFQPVPSAPAGNLVAIAGLGSVVVKSATLADTPGGAPLLPLSRRFHTAPVVRVAVSPTNGVGDLPQLAEGLRRLHAIDPLVEVVLTESGEHLMCTAGEVHLDTCLRDLQDVFAKVPVTASAPLVPFKETVTHSTGDAWGPWTEATSVDGCLVVRARARPLAMQLAAVLLDETGELRSLLSAGDSEALAEEIDNRDDGRPVEFHQPTVKSSSVDTTHVRESILRALDEAKEATVLDPKEWRTLLGRIWAVGSKGGTGNLLLATDLLGSADAAHALGLSVGTAPKVDVPNNRSCEAELDKLAAHVAAGFQLACAGGPLCEEPLHGVCFEAEVRVIDGAENTGLAVEHDAAFGYRAMLLSRDAMRLAVLAAGARLVQAMYACEIAASSDGLGGTYAAVGRTRGRVISETMMEGTGDFLISAMVPVAGSFGFVEDLRSRSGGSAGASMVFSHWEEIEADPTARTMASVDGDEDGIEDESLGNLAVAFVDSVRRRKGLPVEEKVVKSATKQRTRARKV